MERRDVIVVGAGAAGLYCAGQLGLRCCEVPVTRAYPKGEKTPTKISFFKGNGQLLKILFTNLRGGYRP